MIPGDTVLDARYQLEKKLGQGGMGMVFKARHIFIKTQHAIKVILPDLVGNDPSLTTRFRQEAMAAAAIRHQNTVSVTDYGIINGTTPFLVMEFVEGRSLHEILSTERRLEPARAIEIMLAVCAGVAAAHRQGIVHRDLKPLNILIKHDLPTAEAVKVLDFGLAKIKSGELLGSFVAAQTQGMMGSPFYMAPEQWSDDDVDARSDIYSLGVILYQMLAGEVPFKGNSIPSIMNKHLTTAPSPLRERGVEAPPLLESAIEHALEKDPKNRPLTVEEFMGELRAALASLNGDAAAPAVGVSTVQMGKPDTIELGRAKAHIGLVTGAEDESADGAASLETVGDFGLRGGAARTSALAEEQPGNATQAQTPDSRTDELAAGGAPADAVGSGTARHRAEHTVVEPPPIVWGKPTAPLGDASGEHAQAWAEAARAAEEAARLRAAEEARRRGAEEQQRREAEERERRETEERERLEAQERARRESEERERRESEERARRESEERAAREAEERNRREEQERAAATAALAARQQQAAAGLQAGGAQSVSQQVASQSAGVGAQPRSRTPLVVLGVGLVVAVMLLGGLGLLAYFKLRGGEDSANVNAGGVGANSNAVSNSNSGARQSGPVRPDLVPLQGGDFELGRSDVPPITEDLKREREAFLLWMYSQWPANSVTVKPFAIDRTEVTNAEYADFVKETGHAPPPAVWDGDRPKPGEENHPVRNVSYDDAVAFAAWRSRRDGVTYRLPTEAEWEFAARGGDSSALYPWGPQWAAGLANVGAEAPRPVGSFPQGRTPQGVDDMIGNVWEWTSSEAAMYRGNDRTALAPADRGKFVARGGSYASRPDGDEPITATSRRWLARGFRDPVLGFRLVRAEN
ncbi:MAG TPA: bifunctional serine/threonine-protein kinase/formylglycine-generating enzyme family protein [Pyrinomonadaceae bacterium]|nr:bifunctional serine/threonine-protein kinase/formylglycine-generating enzyme family protein [Pyrinomonadaceae bacterium]